jgi:preprotein translocase subunit SecE
MAFSLGNNPLSNYVRESRDELRKVAWPSRQTVIRDTLIVVGISVVMAAFFGALDFGLSTGVQKLLEYRALKG